jgi:outer membrane protein TolC
MGQTLTLNDLLKMADTANPTLRNARLDIDINSVQKKAYLSSRLPRLSATGDYKYNAIIPGQIVPADFFGGPPGTYAQVKFGVPYNLSNSLQLTQVLYNPQLNFGLSALDINQQIVELQYQVAQQEVKSQIANTYFGLQAVSKQIEYLKMNVKNIDQLIQNMELLYQQGLVIPTETDKLRINKISLENAILKLENTKLQLQSLLKILVGMDDKSPMNVEDDQVIQQSLLVDKTTINRPELALINAQKQMNDEETKGNKMAYLPSLNFYASYNYNYNMKPADDIRIGISSAFLGLRLDWTLFDGFEKHNKIKINAMNKEKLETQEQLVTNQMNRLNPEFDLKETLTTLKIFII